MGMQMNSDEMHSDTITIRQQNTVWKVVSYNFRLVYTCYNKVSRF